MNYNMMLTPVIGAVIGYFTNWLAIKMIFKPYDEKKILGIKIPFTPGLMAKERFAMSKKIGKTVSTYLLTEEVLMEAIAEKDFSEGIETLLNEGCGYLVNSNNTVGEELNLKLGEDYFVFKNNLIIKLKKEMMKYIENPILKEEIAKGVKEKIVSLIDDEQSIKVVEELIGKIRLDMEDKSANYIDKLNNDSRPLKELLTTKNQDKVKELISAIIPPLLVHVRVFIENEEGSNMDNELKQLFQKVIVDSYGKFVGTIINPDKIYDNAKVNLIDYISHNQEDVLEKIYDFLDKFMECEVREISRKIPSNSNFVNDAMEFAENFIEKDELSGKAIAEKIRNSFPDIDIRVKEQVYKALNSFIVNKGDETCERIVKAIITQLEKIKISEIGKNLQEADLNKFKSTLEEMLKKGIEKGGTKIIKGLHIEELVEKKINTMPLEEIEDVVISVANKEIKSITIVGGVLGFLIGLVPLIGNLFN